MNDALSHRIVALATSALLLAGLVATLAGIDPLASIAVENRKRSPPPTASVSHWKDYVAQANAYIGDHFGFRSILIRGHALFRDRVLDANSGDNIVLDALGVASD